ncbi:MAG: sulfite exporter TauE/SafE family protein [bacterium]|nr:sulfite exporter TauE/SafE family protein [bacterium]
MLELASLFLLGLVNGGSVCALSCLHYLGPYLVTEGEGFRSGVKTTGWFLAGKAFGYTLLGGAAGLMGQLVNQWMETWGKNLMAVALLGLALSLALRAPKACPKPSGREPFKLFTLGLSTGALPCPALVALLLAASTRGSWVGGVELGLAYGLGIAASPLALVGGGVAHLGRHLRVEVGSFLPWLRRLSFVVIALLGLKLILTEF